MYLYQIDTVVEAVIPEIRSPMPRRNDDMRLIASCTQTHLAMSEECEWADVHGTELVDVHGLDTGAF